MKHRGMPTRVATNVRAAAGDAERLGNERAIQELATSWRFVHSASRVSPISTHSHRRRGWARKLVYLTLYHATSPLFERQDYDRCCALSTALRHSRRETERQVYIMRNLPFRTL